MMFGKTSLTGAISDFRSKKEKREAKIRAKISSLEKEVQDLQDNIRAENQRIVQAELNDDAAAQEKSYKSLRKMRNRLNELEGIIQAYRDELSKNDTRVKDIEEIRATAAREKQARLERLESLKADKAQVEQEIKELENRLERIGQEINRESQRAEAMELEHKHMLDHIEPRAKSIPVSEERYRFLDLWISGEEEAAEGILTRNLPNQQEDNKVRSLKVATTRHAPVTLEEENPSAGPINRPGPEDGRGRVS